MGRRNMGNYKVDVVVEKDADGYFAYCPGLDGCFTQGDSYEEVVENIRDAVRLHIEDRIADEQKK
jgi:predicted RNase H-like HicB family nuclease